MDAMPGSPAFACQEMSMGSTSQGSAHTATQARSFGRGFAAVDPERQREIAFEHARTMARREDPQRNRRPDLAGWLSTQRDPSDDGGSVRRSR
jgi:hypothetical protein